MSGPLYSDDGFWKFEDGQWIASEKQIAALSEGAIPHTHSDNHNQNVISSGEIVKTSTLKILSKSFKMIKPITILTVSKNINKNYKIDNIIK